METLEFFVPVAVFIISFCALFTALGFMFNFILKPVKDNQARIELEQKNIKNMMLKDQEERKEIMSHFASNAVKLNKNIEKINGILKILQAMREKLKTDLDIE